MYLKYDEWIYRIVMLFFATQFVDFVAFVQNDVCALFFFIIHFVSCFAVMCETKVQFLNLTSFYIVHCWELIKSVQNTRKNIFLWFMVGIMLFLNTYNDRSKYSFIFGDKQTIPFERRQPQIQFGALLRIQ